MVSRRGASDGFELLAHCHLLVQGDKQSSENAQAESFVFLHFFVSFSPCPVVTKWLQKHHVTLPTCWVVGRHWPTMTRAAKTFNLGDTLTRAWCKRNLFANACATCGKRCGSKQRLRKHLHELQHFQNVEKIKRQSKAAIRAYNKNKTKKNLKRALKLGAKDANLVHVFR